jgi:hypothetical protein
MGVKGLGSGEGRISGGFAILLIPAEPNEA